MNSGVESLERVLKMLEEMQILSGRELPIEAYQELVKNPLTIHVLMKIINTSC